MALGRGRLAIGLHPSAEIAEQFDYTIEFPAWGGLAVSSKAANEYGLQKPSVSTEFARNHDGSHIPRVPLKSKLPHTLLYCATDGELADLQRNALPIPTSTTSNRRVIEIITSLPEMGVADDPFLEDGYDLMPPTSEPAAMLADRIWHYGSRATVAWQYNQIRDRNTRRMQAGAMLTGAGITGAAIASQHNRVFGIVAGTAVTGLGALSIYRMERSQHAEEAERERVIEDVANVRGTTMRTDIRMAYGLPI